VLFDTGKAPALTPAKQVITWCYSRSQSWCERSLGTRLTGVLIFSSKRSKVRERLHNMSSLGRHMFLSIVSYAICNLECKLLKRFHIYAIYIMTTCTALL